MKKMIIPILLLLLQILLIISREIWSFPKSVSIVISSVNLIAALIILLWVISIKK